MYKVSKIEVEGFWNNNYYIDMKMHDDVNIFIGKNGSGKTTFINLLQGLLAIDIDKLAEVFFTKATIVLKKDNKIKTIKITRVDNIRGTPIVRYQISNNKAIELPVVTSESLRAYPYSSRRRMKDDYDRLKLEMQKIIAISSLSVYRNNYEYDFDYREYNRERNNRFILSPVDDRLNNLLERLTRYQLELSSKLRAISAQLQKEVLLSLLDIKKNTSVFQSIVRFNSDEQKTRLINAYKKLGLNSREVGNKINQYIQAMEDIKNNFNREDVVRIDFSVLEVMKMTNRIIDLSLEAERKSQEVFEQLELYLGELNNFMEKKFSFSQSGDLRIEEEYSIDKLSSGEKQLLILLTETVLQQKKSFIFLADEPELSLHIKWQKEILPAVRKINPNAQIIIATHSPEIAGGYRDKIIPMKDILLKN